MTATYAAQVLNTSDLFACIKSPTQSKCNSIRRDETELCLVTCGEVKVGNGAVEQSCSQHRADEGSRIPYPFCGMICDVEETERLLYFHEKRSCCFR
jgi:hypothetical protein